MLRRKTILIVDDEPDIRDIFTMTFKEMNATVFEAANGQEAFNILLQQNITHVLTDIRMPGGDGLMLIKDIRSKLPYQPVIIVCSGYNDLNSSHEIEFNISKVFTKPFRIENILEELIKN